MLSFKFLSFYMVCFIVFAITTVLPSDVLNEDITHLRREFEKFVVTFAPSSDLERTLQKEKKLGEVGDQKLSIVQGLNEDCNFIDKGDDLARVINGYLVRKIIEKNNLTLAVPTKYVVKINGKYRVFSEYIVGKQVENLSLEQTKQLAYFLIKTNFVDIKKDNLIINEKNGMLTVIDTEDRSFGKGIHPGDSKKLFVALNDFPQDFLTVENNEWFVSYCAELFENQKNERVIPLPVNQFQNKFLGDEIGVDFVAVRKYLKMVRNRPLCQDNFWDNYGIFSKKIVGGIGIVLLFSFGSFFLYRLSKCSNIIV